MMQGKVFTWSALEYEEKERSRDWFWALGIIVVTGAIASIIFSNYFFAALLVLGGVMLAFYAIKKPDLINYELNEEGLLMKHRFFPYENIKAFWVQADFTPNSKLKPMLFIHIERAFLPVISIPIHIESAEDIHNIFTSQEIAEVPMKPHPAETVMDVLGF
jgi:hypothetical protein